VGTRNGKDQLVKKEQPKRLPKRFLQQFKIIWPVILKYTTGPNSFICSIFLTLYVFSQLPQQAENE
jgi:hypothetical protein